MVGTAADLGRTVWAGDCRGYFHNAAGDIVTQLPRTSGWYREATKNIDPADFVFHTPSSPGTHDAPRGATSTTS